MFMHHVINILMLARWAGRANSFILISLDWPKANKTKTTGRECKKLSVMFKPSYGNGQNEGISVFLGRFCSLLL